MNNQFTVKGWLQDGVDLRFSKDTGKPYAFGQIAYRGRVKEGDVWKPGPTSWFDFTAFGNQAEILAELPTGTQVLLDGRLEMHYWTNEETGARGAKPKITVDDVALPVFSADALDISEDFIAIRRHKGGGKRGKPIPTGIEDYSPNEEPFVFDAAEADHYAHGTGKYRP